MRQAVAKGGGKLLRDHIRAARPYIFERADLEKLAATTGGKALKSKEVGMLAESVEALMLTG